MTMRSNPAVAEIERGIYEADAAPGQVAHVLYIGGERVARVECAPAVQDQAITMLWRMLVENDQHLKLV